MESGVRIYPYISNYSIWLLAVILVTVSCDDIPRDNPFDPKNPASFRSQPILLEAFVNNNEDPINAEVNQYMLTALNQLISEYSDKIAIAEYHRGSLEDSLSRSENDILYNKYLSGLGSSLKGVPDVFINGIATRITGASSTENARARLETAVESFLTDISEFTLEVQISRANSQIEIDVNIAKLGDSGAEDIVVRTILTEFLQSPFHKNVVRRILNPEIIPSIENGEIKTVSITPFPAKTSAERKVIISVTSEDELEVFQTIEVSLNE
jgi:hypothetical protein